MEQLSDDDFAVILDEVVARTRMERFRQTTDPSHPDYHPGAREAVVLIHRGQSKSTTAPPSSAYPPLMKQVANAAAAAVAFVRDGFKLVDRAEQARRLAICRKCEHFDAKARRCRQCGCQGDIKALVRSSKCKLGKW